MWKDTTGSHRSGSRAQSDYEACASEAGPASSDKAATHDESEARRQRLQICMYARGWRPTDLQRF
jgi:hypothetical protein